MQQVNNRPTAAVISAADMRHFPTRAKNARTRKSHALVSLQHKWILHSKLWVRVGVALVCALIFAVAFQARGGIMNGVTSVSNVVSAGLATGGLRVSEIDFSGQSIALEQQMLTALNIDESTSILGFDVDAARLKLLEIPVIKDVTLRKVYPNKLVVSVTEHAPVARWHDGDAAYLIDAAGVPLGLNSGAYSDLPLVIGGGAADNALSMIRALEGYESLQSGLIAISRIADRRWDLIYDTGLRVQLPEVGVRQALIALTEYQNEHQLLDRDLSLIDLRVEDSLVVRVTPREVEDAN